LQKTFLDRKKAEKIAYYRTTERIQNLRLSFRELISNFHPHNLIYIDETHIDSKTKEVIFFLK